MSFSESMWMSSDVPSVLHAALYRCLCKPLGRGSMRQITGPLPIIRCDKIRENTEAENWIRVHLLLFEGIIYIVLPWSIVQVSASETAFYYTTQTVTILMILIINRVNIVLHVILFSLNLTIWLHITFTYVSECDTPPVCPRRNQEQAVHAISGPAAFFWRKLVNHLYNLKHDLLPPSPHQDNQLSRCLLTINLTSKYNSSSHGGKWPRATDHIRPHMSM